MRLPGDRLAGAPPQARSDRRLREVMAIVRLIRSERPDIVHCIALRMVVLGGVTSSMAGVKRLVLAVTGLGTLWIAADAKTAIARAVVRWLVRRLIARGAAMIFENHDDPHEFGLDPGAGNLTILPGAGVDPAQFAPGPEPASPPVKFAIVSRMLRTKGSQRRSRPRARPAPMAVRPNCICSAIRTRQIQPLAPSLK